MRGRPNPAWSERCFRLNRRILPARPSALSNPAGRPPRRPAPSAPPSGGLRVPELGGLAPIRDRRPQDLPVGHRAQIIYLSIGGPGFQPAADDQADHHLIGL